MRPLIHYLAPAFRLFLVPVPLPTGGDGGVRPPEQETETKKAIEEFVRGLDSVPNPFEYPFFRRDAGRIRRGASYGATRHAWIATSVLFVW